MAEQAKSVVVALKMSLTEKSSPPCRPCGCVCYCRSLSQPISNRFFRGGTRFEWFSTPAMGMFMGGSVLPKEGQFIIGNANQGTAIDPRSRKGLLTRAR